MREFVAEADVLLRDYGVAVESWSTELGYGNIECATNAAAAARRRPTSRPASRSG